MFTWLTDHLPWAADISAPLHELSTSKDWEWTATHENAFKRMKQIIGGSEVLTPLDLRPGAPPIRVVSDASLSGIGGYLCQGDTLETSKPAVYHSRVFNSAQRNYPVHEQELLAVEDLVKSNEHLLIGRPFTVVTDSQAMLSLMKQKHLSPRQWRTVTYLSKFDINFEFVPGKKNVIADLLSRIAERSTYQCDLPELEESDLHLNAMSLQRGKVLLEELAIKKRSPAIPLSHETAPTSPESVSSSSSLPTTPASSDDEAEWPDAMPDAMPEAADRQVTGSENFLTEFSTDFHQTIVDGYKDDSQFSKALVAGVESDIYVLRNGLLYLAMPGAQRLCIPDTKVEGQGKGERKKKSAPDAYGACS